MQVTFLLWLFTSAYAQPIGVYPAPEVCAQAALSLAGAWEEARAKPFLYRLACIPTIRQFDPPPKRREFGASFP